MPPGPRSVAHRADLAPSRCRDPTLGAISAISGPKWRENQLFAPKETANKGETPATGRRATGDGRGRPQPSSPVSSSRSKASSSICGTPSSVALASLAPPGSLPTTTAVVFCDTLPGAFPPRDFIAASATSRDHRSRVPVTTTDLPTRFWGRAGAPGPSKLRPASLRRSTTCRLRGKAKNREMLAAITGPIQPSNGGHFLFRRRHYPVQVPHGPGEDLAAVGTEVADGQADQEVGQGPGFRGFYGGLQVGHRERAKTFVALHTVEIERINIGHIRKQTFSAKQ